MVKLRMAKILFLILLGSLLLLPCGTCLADFRDIDLNRARILDYRGLVEINRNGILIKVRPNTALLKTDEITVYYDSYLELYFDSKKSNIVKIEGEKSFTLQDLSKVTPYSFEVRSLPNKRRTETVLIFSEESWTNKYLDLLQKGGIPYTVVLVREGVVAAKGLGLDNPKEILVRGGQLTYIFEGKNPFSAMPGGEFIDMCIEDCWGQW